MAHGFAIKTKERRKRPMNTETISNYESQISKILSQESDQAKAVKQIANLLSTEQIRFQNLAKTNIQACDDFIAMLSHEIRNPLTSLMMSTQMLKSFFRSDDPKSYSQERAQKHLHDSEVNIEKITKLAENLQVTASLQHGNLRLTPEDFVLAELIESVIDFHRGEFEKWGCDVEWLPPEPFKVRWDRLCIEQILNNIFENAIKYGARKPIRIAATQEAEKAKISVTDCGIGIAPEHIDRIFERYDRGSAHDDGSPPGFGLGLYIARQIAKAHGGEISVESTVGNGSTFFIEIPCKPGKG